MPGFTSTAVKTREIILPLSNCFPDAATNGINICFPGHGQKKPWEANPTIHLWGAAGFGGTAGLSSPAERGIFSPRN
jgi:hypothetical protein